MAGDLWLLVSAAVLVVLAGSFSAADAALGGFSRARAEELLVAGKPGARRLLRILDPTSDPEGSRLTKLLPWPLTEA